MALRVAQCLEPSYVAACTDRCFFDHCHHSFVAQLQTTTTMRFLHLIRPVMCVLPEVASPDRKVSGHMFVLSTSLKLAMVLPISFGNGLCRLPRGGNACGTSHFAYVRIVPGVYGARDRIQFTIRMARHPVDCCATCS